MDLTLTRPVIRNSGAWRTTGSFIAAACGFALLFGTAVYLLEAGRANPRILLLALPMSLLAGGYLLACEFGDAGFERGLVARFGASHSSQALEGIVAVAFLTLGLLPLLGLPQGVWFGVAAMPFAAGAARKLVEHPEAREAIIPAQQMMQQAMLVFAAAVSAGLLVSSH